MRRLLIAVFTAVSLCTSTAAAPERPVVFIPGILGTKLCKDNKDNTVLWGNALSLRNFESLELKGGASASGIKTCGLIKSINLLGPFWTVHQYDTILSTLHDLGYVEGTNLFVFPYDWRLSNFETAKALKKFIEEDQQELRNGKFDIVAHSMGGLVTRIYLQQYGGAAKVRKVIYLGTPFQGSMNALATLSQGWGRVANGLAGGLDGIRKTILSMPAFYELFPRYACCRIGSESQFEPVDIFSYEVWLRYNWLPLQFSSGPSAIAAKENLQQAANLRELLRSKEVVGVKHVVIAGDAFATRYYLYAAKENPTWQNWRFTASRGDGTVPVWSAANDLTSITGTHPSFSEHATIFDDQATKNMLLRELVSNLPPPVASTDALFRLTTTNGTKTARLLDVSIEPNTILPGDTAHLSVIVDFNERVDRSEFLPSAELIGPNGSVALTVTEKTDESQRAAQRLAFSADIPAPLEQGAWRVNVTFPGQGTHATFFETWGAQ